MSMTQALAEALMFNGIIPPNGDSKKTTCPMCSHNRKKAAERCLSVFAGPGWVEWKCHHCGWKDGDIVA